jgi:hypothetical protein
MYAVLEEKLPLEVHFHLNMSGPVPRATFLSSTHIRKNWTTTFTESSPAMSRTQDASSKPCCTMHVLLMPGRTSLIKSGAIASTVSPSIHGSSQKRVLPRFREEPGSKLMKPTTAHTNKITTHGSTHPKVKSERLKHIGYTQKYQ